MRYLLSLLLLAVAPVAFAQDANEKEEQAMKAASAGVAPSVVKIETVGGQDVMPSGPAGPGPRAPGIRKGVGPTTGVVVAADGYIITSSFNFANKPSDIFVTVPNRPGRLVAKQIATDTTRMLTLVKIDAKDLPVPTAVPKADIAIGQWSLALGRTLMPDVGAMPPSVSAGIISAVGRINGKCLQTDAKVSPVNYGGPLVGIDGRVQGILVPASQNAEGDVSGVEWYDSGIGFAIPFEDVLAVVPKLREGKNLRRGLMGITPQSQEQYLAAVVVGTISPDSAAAKAGLKVGDKIVTIDKKPVVHMVGMQHILGPKYEGDVIDIKVLRDGNEMDFPGVKLTGVITAVASGFLGILPLRDDPDPGVPVRFVYPKSPAEIAGLKVGDRIMKVSPILPGGQKAPPPLELTQGRTQLNAIVGRTPPGQELQFEVKRAGGDKTETVKVKLTAVPDEELPAALPLPSSAERALDKPKGAKDAPKPKEEPKKEEPKKDKDDEKKDDKEPEVGMLKKKNAVLGREYWVYVPLNYKPSVSHGLIVWLHPAGKGGKDADEMAKIWRPFLEDYHYILVGPKSQSNDGWVASETEGIMADVKEVIAQHTIDRSRIIAHGMGVGGQMAFYLGFSARDTIRGVATTGASLGTQPKDIVPAQPLAFFIVGGEKDPAVKSIADSIPPLKDKKFPVIYRQLKDFGKEYMLQPTLIELCVWIDSIDKI
ncbi:PDZ domain-containing protein [Limnoglobus roseus]|uniref:PDZ domain-containing protein n=1 Tax=Limnoglobus roseus TaxID=2598579 RepID=A0A5C1AM78_9BACT|nr:PDZ domain-containing protein [Limnoglobus roseus]QEL20331.1 PDZ domain-containing protein [Limnoglobus roseus]